MVEHQGDGLCHCGHRGRDARRRCRYGRRASNGAVQRRVDRLDAFERGRRIRHELAEVVVITIERQPRDACVIVVRPLRKERRFAVPGGRDDRRNGRGVGVREPVDQRSARHHGGPRRGRVQLRLEKCVDTGLVVSVPRVPEANAIPLSRWDRGACAGYALVLSLGICLVLSRSSRGRPKHVLRQIPKRPSERCAVPSGISIGQLQTDRPTVDRQARPGYGRCAETPRAQSDAAGLPDACKHCAQLYALSLVLEGIELVAERRRE